MMDVQGLFAVPAMHASEIITVENLQPPPLPAWIQKQLSVVSARVQTINLLRDVGQLTIR